MPRTMYRCTNSEKKKIGMIVTTPTVAAMFQSMGRWAEIRPAAPSGIVLSPWLLMR